MDVASLQTWVSGILAAFVIGGITGLVVLYGDVGKMKSDQYSMQRDLDRIYMRANIYGEAIARLEEHDKSQAKCK